MEEETDIKIKTRFLGDVIVQHARPPLVLDTFFSLLKDACKQSQAQKITVKWIDEDGDPVTIESQMELDEAVRILHQNEEAEMDVHVFLGGPAQPGLPCEGEDKNIYRRGARRWNKVYLYNGHRFQAKRLNRRVHCIICSDYIWGLGRAGYRCTSCRICVHKKCVRSVHNFCGQSYEPKLNVAPPVISIPPSALKGSNGERRSYVGQINGAFQESEIETQAEAIHMESVPKWSVSIDDFKFLTVIGRGSYAKVVQAEHKRTHQIYAIKIIKKQMFNEDEDIEWVQTEKAVFEAASNHPFLVGLHSCFQTSSRLFFVIEFVPGGDLMYHMQRQRKLAEDHARFYSAEIILALHFLHSRGIIYRDLKLDNVLIDSDGHIKLTDYGMCKENIGPTDTTTTFCGTPNYIAPEILRGEPYGFSVDWWALGVLMYEMMAGKSPFDVFSGVPESDQNTEDYLFQTILERTIRIPRSLSVRASEVLKGFLDKDPTTRLGCKPDLNDSLTEMKEHRFFSGLIDFDELEQKLVAPPYNPSISSDRDLQHFDQQFTDEPPTLTPDDSRIIEKIDQTEFDGFEYVNPLQMSREDSV